MPEANHEEICGPSTRRSRKLGQGSRRHGKKEFKPPDKNLREKQAPPEAQAGSVSLTACLPSKPATQSRPARTMLTPINGRARLALPTPADRKKGFSTTACSRRGNNTPRIILKFRPPLNRVKPIPRIWPKRKPNQPRWIRPLLKKSFPKYPEDLTRAGIPSGKINSTRCDGRAHQRIAPFRQTVEVINAWAKMWKSMQARQKTLRTMKPIPVLD